MTKRSFSAKLKSSANLFLDDCHCGHLSAQLSGLIGEQELLPALFDPF
jgi:hypothetical protein